MHAEALLKPVPQPDLSTVPGPVAERMRKARESFEAERKQLAGEPLAEAYALMAAVYARNGFYEPASVAIEDAVLLAPKDGRWRYIQGIVLLGDKNTLGAKAAFEHAFALDQVYLPIRTAAATQKIQSGDLDGARRMLEEYTAQKKDQAVPLAMLGDIALKQKRYADAIALYQAALKLEPAANKLHGSLAEAYAASGNAKAAADARSKAGDAPPTLYDPLGGGLFGREKPTASSTARSASSAQPADPKARAIADAVAQIGRRQYAAARTHLDKALALAPKDANLLALYARVEAMSGNAAAARTRAAAAIAADARNPVTHYSQGVVLEVAGDDAGAQRSYQEAVRLDPKGLNQRISLGNLLLRNGRAADAVAQYRAAAALPNATEEAVSRLLAAEFEAGRCTDGLKDINAALSKAPKDAYLLQLFVRAASTCPAAGANEKRMALDYGSSLYKATEAPQIGEAYALALAASGKWDDAVKTQQAAMFVALRTDGKDALKGYQDTLKLLQSKKLPAGPWPAGADIYRPSRLQSDSAPAAAPAKR